MSLFMLQRNRPVQVQWHNELVDLTLGGYLQHLFADQVDRTLHW
jgi:hypothetical protein